MKSKSNTMTKHINSKVFIFLSIILAISVFSIHSQIGRGNERLKGVVVDENDQPIISANVIIQFKGYYTQKPNTLSVDFIPASETTYQNLKFEVKTNKKGDHEIDARALVRSISLVSPNKLQLTIKQTDGPGLKPTEIVKGIFSLTDDDLLTVDVLKTGQVLA